MEEESSSTTTDEEDDANPQPKANPGSASRASKSPRSSCPAQQRRPPATARKRPAPSPVEENNNNLLQKRSKRASFALVKWLLENTADDVSEEDVARNADSWPSKPLPSKERNLLTLVLAELKMIMLINPVFLSQRFYAWCDWSFLARNRENHIRGLLKCNIRYFPFFTQSSIMFNRAAPFF